MDLLMMIAYMLVTSFLILGVAAAAVAPFSLDRFLSFLHIWRVSFLSSLPILFFVAAFFLPRKIAGWSGGGRPKSILELARQRPLTPAGSENLSSVVEASSPETWFDFIWKPPPSHPKEVPDDYLAALPPLAEETEPPTPCDEPPPPLHPPAPDYSCDAPSAPAYYAAYGGVVPPSPVHSWYDVPSSPAPYSPSYFFDVPPSPAYHAAYDDFPPSPAHAWHDVPSSPAPYSHSYFCDVPPSPAYHAAYDDFPPSPAHAWHDVPSSPAPYSSSYFCDVPPSPYSWYDVPSSPAYDRVPSSPADGAAMYSSRRSPHEVAPELFQPEAEKDAAEPWEPYKPLFDRYWNDVPSPRLAHTAAADFSFYASPFEDEPWPSHLSRDDNKSIDETWSSIVDGGRSLAKSLRRHHRHEAAKKGPKRAEITSSSKEVAVPPGTRKGLKRAEKTKSSRGNKEIILVSATRKEPTRTEITSSSGKEAAEKGPLKKTKAPKKETGWRGIEVLTVSKEDQDELFQRAETLIKKHYDDLRLQRQESAKRRSLLEKIRWT